MYQKILVPIDGSETADRGLKEAIALAGKLGARVRVMHVMGNVSGATAEGIAFSPEALEQLKGDAERMLDDARWKVRSAGLEADTVLANGFGERRLHDFIKEQVAEWGAELVVLGTHGRRGIRRLVLGSDAETIVRTATVPILLVRAQ